MPPLIPGLRKTITRSLALVTVFCSPLLAQSPDTDSLAIAPQTPVVRERKEIVRVGGDIRVASDESCEEAVAILGNARIDGRVLGDAVVVGGTLEIHGTVGGQAVVVGGKLIVADNARVLGGTVAVGASAQISETANVQGQQVEIGAMFSGIFAGMKQWLTTSLFKGRLIAPELPWTIIAFSAFLLLAMLLSALFPVLYNEGVTLIQTRPGMVLLFGILAYIGLPVLSFLLATTVIGIPLVPVVHLFSFGIGLIGLFSLFSYAGRQTMAGLFRVKEFPLLAGGLIIAVLYVLLAMVPIAGMLAVMLATTLGLGAGIHAFVELVRRPKKTGGPSAGVTSGAPLPAGTGGGETVVSPRESTRDTSSPFVTAGEVTRQASFGERFGAAAIDLLLIMLLQQLAIKPLVGLLPLMSCPRDGGSVFLALLLVYLVIMWAWKSTTIGNTVFHLAIRRVGDGALTPGNAVVRGLSLILSLAPLGLGFFWMIWDRNHQTWHDKIAGTEVVRMPSSERLL